MPGLAKLEHNEPWSIADSVDSPSALEYFGGTGINIRCAVEDGSVLFDRGIGRIL